MEVLLIFFLVSGINIHFLNLSLICVCPKNGYNCVLHFTVIINLQTSELSVPFLSLHGSFIDFFLFSGCNIMRI